MVLIGYDERKDFIQDTDIDAYLSKCHTKTVQMNLI